MANKKAKKDPAYVSKVRRAAALASAEARRARSATGGQRPKTVPVKAETFAKVKKAAAQHRRTITDLATEAIEHGLPIALLPHA